jgi:hypothetical protein
MGIKKLFAGFVVAMSVALAGSIAPAGAASSVKAPVYKPVTPKAWTWSPTFNKAKFDSSIIKLSSPSDWKLTPKAAKLITGLPTLSNIDLRTWAEPIGNQGGVQSCVSWTAAYALLGWWENKSKNITSDEWFNPMSVYSVTRKPEDRGSWPKDAFNRITTIGAVKAADYSVDEFTFGHTPTGTELLKGLPYRFSSWRPLYANPNPYDGGGSAGASMIKNELRAGRPVAIASRVYNDFTSMGAKSSGFVYSKSSTAVYRGLHAMLAIGYSPSGLLLQNSWGTGFGDKGYVRVSWSYVNDDIFEADVADGVS